MAASRFNNSYRAAVRGQMEYLYHLSQHYHHNSVGTGFFEPRMNQPINHQPTPPPGAAAVGGGYNYYNPDDGIVYYLAPPPPPRRRQRRYPINRPNPTYGHQLRQNYYPSYNNYTMPPWVIRDQRQALINAAQTIEALIQQRLDYVNSLWTNHQTTSSTTTTGLSKEVISKHLKTRKSSEEDDGSEICVVCQDCLHQKEEDNEYHTIGMLGCRHNYHVTCIENWLQRKNTCPLCNTTGLSV